jgi:hypothetical protein
MSTFARLTLKALLGLVLLVPMSKADLVGLTVTVSKRTLPKTVPVSGSFGNSGRLQALKLNVKNASIRALPEGNLEWTLIVRRVYGGLGKYSGSGVLPALKSLQTAEIELGAVDAGAAQTLTGPARDKVEYEIIVSHGGKESFRSTSCANFAQLAATATDYGGVIRAVAEAQPGKSAPSAAKGSAGKPVDPDSRLFVTVSKKTVARPILNPQGAQMVGMIQGLKLSAKNGSIRDLPAGKVDWTLVVRKLYGVHAKYSGTAVLPALRSLQAAEVEFGAVEIASAVTTAGIETEKMEYDVIVSHDGRQTARSTSCSDFAKIAATAPDYSAGAGNAAPPQPVTPPPPAAAVMPPEPPTPAAVSTVPTAPPPAPPVEPPPVPQRPFDFFNLGGKKPAPKK